MSQHLSFREARELFGADLFAADLVAQALGEAPPRDADQNATLPLSRADARAARETGAFLIQRQAALADGAGLTLALLHQRFKGSSGAGAPRFRGEDPWFLGQDFAEHETPELGWALVAKEPWPQTLNQTFDQASEALSRFAGGARWRRRRAVEIALDCLVVAAIRGERLLASTWDWSSSSASDGGRINVGGFGGSGLEVLSYSKAVKHGALGVCPTLVAR
jgi:hypothetical protein